MTNNSTNNNIILIIINVCSNIFGSRFELVSGVPHRPPGQLPPLPRTFLLRMDVAAEVDPSESLFAQRAEEFVEQISNENAVSSESASLVVALSYLYLQVTEEQVVEATLEILKPPEIQFSKDVFFKSLSVGEVVAFGTLAPSNTGTYGRCLRTITQLWRSTAYIAWGSRGKTQYSSPGRGDSTTL